MEWTQQSFCKFHNGHRCFTVNTFLLTVYITVWNEKLYNSLIFVMVLNSPKRISMSPWEWQNFKKFLKILRMCDYVVRSVE